MWYKHYACDYIVVKVLETLVSKDNVQSEGGNRIIKKYMAFQFCM